MTGRLLIDETLKRINQEYQPGTLAWMKANRPNDWGSMLNLERSINKTALEGNFKSLREALDEYQGLILAMVREFRTLKEVMGQGSFSFVERPKSPWDG